MSFLRPCPISQHKLSAELALSAGGATMCVDCGGGTVDIIVHRQEERTDGSLSLREVVKGTGDCCGGAAVDAAFIQLIAGTIPVFDEYANRNPQEVSRTVRQLCTCADVMPPAHLTRTCSSRTRCAAGAAHCDEQDRARQALLCGRGRSPDRPSAQAGALMDGAQASALRGIRRGGACSEYKLCVVARPAALVLTLD